MRTRSALGYFEVVSHGFSNHDHRRTSTDPCGWNQVLLSDKDRSSRAPHQPKDAESAPLRSTTKCLERAWWVLSLPARIDGTDSSLLSKVRLLREELQLLHEPGSYVGEVVKIMGKNKVLVKVQPEGKYSAFQSHHFSSYAGDAENWWSSRGHSR